MHTISLQQLRFADLIRADEVIAWPQGPGEPLALTELLVTQGPMLQRPTLLFGLTQSNTLQPELGRDFKFRALNGAGNSRRVTAMAEIFPAHLSALPGLFRTGGLQVDVCLVQVRALPDGGFTLGVICDFTRAMMQRSRLVIALLNPALPCMGGEARVESADIDVLVDGDDRIIDLPDPVPTSVERNVARHVAELIPDRATVQLGVGTLPVAVAEALRDHQGLGVHSGVLSDAIIDLMERGVVTNAHKGIDVGKTVTGGLFGTQRLRTFAERSGLFDMRSADYTHQPAVMASLSTFHSINSGIEVDLSGQVNAEVAGGRYLGAVGGYLDFIRGGVASPGGCSIIAFPSTTPNGRHSRIVASLGDRPVTAPRSDVHLIVTEYGTANLLGCSLPERARRLVRIAHPAHREALARGLNPL
ncbi:Acyl-CoA hydrolase [Variovorax sp. YR266]|uniref:acetyl-CoA hydrolase/transferase family protein n=1 Tax=Variovorax sp. YR266 TaxID=1884386 RepID=UPI000896CD6F|nr:acetyl-CoA hydrolase/transferase C-terminal domain-containing protein [Variovorax sp. YR266]SDZ70846.1 Acyl-CoA hydrolase [Variovorax sp. YR266]